MSRFRIALAMLAACVVSGCEGTPGDPLDPRTDLAAVLAPGGALSPAGLSLPGLVHAAVHRTYTRQGAGAARALVNDLRRLQQHTHEAQGGEGEADAARARATREEELRIVLRVFGEAIVVRVIDAVAAEAARLEERVLRADALPAAQAADLLTDGLLLLDTAQEAAGARRWVDALDAATRAASMVAAGRAALEDGRRVNGLEELFEDASARLRQASGDGAADAALARHETLRQEAASLSAPGEARRLHATLRSQRDEQIRIVLQVFGEAAVRDLVSRAGEARNELDEAVRHARASGVDVLRFERMSDSAHDMLNRAAFSLEAGDAATALDLGSHAAGLINAARTAIAR